MPPKKAALEQIANARKEVEQVRINFVLTIKVMTKYS